MQIMIFSTIGILIIILGVMIFTNRVKNHKEQLELLTKGLPEIDDPIEDFMCIMLTDGSTIISGKNSNGKRFSVKGMAR